MTSFDIPPHTFAIRQSFEALDTGWRPFPGHYLLYAASGAFHLEVEQAQWLLPPQRAALIKAGVPIRLYTRGTVTCNSVLFAAGTIPEPAFECRVFRVTPLAREMLLYAMRWDRQRSPAGEQAERFFHSLADVCAELAAQPDQLWLPRARSPELGRAIEYTLAHLAEPLAIGDAAQAAGISERTLVRRFAEETHMTWREFVGRARMIRALELLATPTLQIIEVAYASGFESVSAFSTAFRRFSGETPSSYRRRLV